MALGTTIQMNHNALVGQHVAPVSLFSPWYAAIAATGVDDQDAATITNPTTQITASTRKLLRRSSGSLLTFSLQYDRTLTSITAPVIKVFGRKRAGDGESDGRWELLKNKNGDLAITLTPASTDVDDGTYKYTTVDMTNHVVDTQGCDEFLVGIETALAGSTGVATTAVLNVREL